MTKMSSRSRCCCRGSSAGTGTMCMVTLCLIQGLLWSSFSVFLLAVQTCALQFESSDNINIRTSSSKFSYVLNLISAAYLSGSCTKQNLDIRTTDISTSDRTYDLLVIHGFLNAVWIPISVLLIVGIISRFRGCCVIVVIYVPWLLITFGVVAFDLFSASLYARDIDHAKTLRSFLLYIRFKTSTDDIIPESYQWDEYTFYAPLLVMMYFTRFAILTMFNVVTFLHILGVVISLCRERKFAPTNGLFLDGYDEIYSPIIHNEVENIPLQFKDKGMGNYYTTDLEMRTSHGKPLNKNLYQNRDYTVHDYLTLIQTPVYQHVYEDIWRDVKKEKLVYASKNDRTYYNGNLSSIESSSPVYDYLGRPVLAYKTEAFCNAIEENNSDPCRTSISVKDLSNPCSRSNPCIPPALPPCNQEKDKKKWLSVSNVQPPSHKASSCSDYETIDSLYYGTNQAFEGDGDDTSELYSSVKKLTPLAKKKSVISFQEYTDSAYNSGSSVNNYGSIQGCSDDRKSNKSEYSYITLSDSKRLIPSSTNQSGITKTFNSSDDKYSDLTDITDKSNASDEAKKYKDKDSVMQINKSIISDIEENCSSYESESTSKSTSESSETNYSECRSKRGSNYSIVCTSNSSASEEDNENENSNAYENNIISKTSNDNEDCSNFDAKEDSCKIVLNTSNDSETNHSNVTKVNNNANDDKTRHNVNSNETTISIEKHNHPEPPDITNLSAPHPEQRKSKRNLPPLMIKSLSPQIDISSTDQEEDFRVRM